MTVNIVTGSMLKGLREAGCRITTICKCKGYTSLYSGRGGGGGRDLVVALCKIYFYYTFDENLKM